MRSLVLLALGVGLTSCMPAADTAYYAVSLPAPYDALPTPPPGTPIEFGRPVKLDDRQQTAVITGVIKWMKNPASVSFGDMVAARNSSGWITVCGVVNGRNTAGTYVGMMPYIGVLRGASSAPDFVVVDIAANGKPREGIESMCLDSGITRFGR